MGYKNQGLQVLFLDFKKNRLALKSSILNGSSVKDIVELNQDLILALTHKDPIYYRISMVEKNMKALGDGKGKVGLSLALFPGFDSKTYPYLLSKESDGIYLLNPIANTYERLHLFSNQDSSSDCINHEESIFFDKKQANAFYTIKNGYFLTRFEINPLIMEAMRHHRLRY